MAKHKRERVRSAYSPHTTYSILHSLCVSLRRLRENIFTGLLYNNIEITYLTLSCVMFKLYFNDAEGVTAR